MISGEFSPRVRDVILRDGTTMRLRPPERSDLDLVLAFFGGLTVESLYTRFHGIPRVAAKLVEGDLDPDWVERGALVGTVGEGVQEQIVALASYVRLRDLAVAEVAFAVADATQGKGVGTRLLEQLAETASSVGIGCFVAEVLADNRPMLGVLADAGFEQTRERESGVVEVRLALGSTARYLDRVDDRDPVSYTHLTLPTTPYV